MQAEIGNAAGVIWGFLDRQGETTLAQLKQGTKLPDQLLLMGIGWLAKEEKLSFTREGRILKIQLKGTLEAPVPACGRARCPCGEGSDDHPRSATQRVPSPAFRRSTSSVTSDTECSCAPRRVWPRRSDLPPAGR